MRIPPWLFFVQLTVADTSVVAATPTVFQWQPFNFSLTANKTYSNPYMDVDVVVTFTDTQGVLPNRTGLGFWDGGSTWRVSTFFDTPGEFRWYTAPQPTTSAHAHPQPDPGLTATGNVRVLPAQQTTNNPFWTKGSLRVSDAGLNLEHSSGEPFFWLGDTAWAAPMHADEAHWSQYLDRRAVQGFTAVQVGIAQSWMGPVNLAGEAPFGDGLNMTQLNPVFFQDFDGRLETAASAGLAVLVVGIMQPASWHGNYPASEVACRFARHFAARVSGMNHVLLSPSFDARYLPLGNQVGAALVSAGVRGRHLLTLHPGTDLANEIAYYDVPNGSWVDFYGIQTGYGEGGYKPDPNGSAYEREREQSMFAAQNWTAIVFLLPKRKPVVALEQWYDANGCDTSYPPPEPCSWCSGNATTARNVAYTARLSGAIGGTTYGSWVSGWDTNQSSCAFWAKHVDLESAKQMGYLRWFFETGLPRLTNGSAAWTRLLPAPHRLRENAPGPTTNPTQVVALAEFGEPTRNTVVAYLQPSTTRVVFTTNDTLSGDGAHAGSRWWDPATNTTTDASSTCATVAPGVVSCTKPTSSNDSLLVYAGSDVDARPHISPRCTISRTSSFMHDSD